MLGLAEREWRGEAELEIALARLLPSLYGVRER
jgi:hypothetical protein